jgi:hypothetical protein
VLAHPTGAAVTVATTAGPEPAAVSLARLSPKDPSSARRLAEAASRLLENGAPLDESNLTAVGAPLELTFVWPPNELRIAVDPCPGGTARQRTQACLKAMAGALSPQQLSLVGKVNDWHQRHQRRYGAWLGFRANNGDIRRKLYLELPETAPWPDWEREVVGKPPVLPSRRVQATMIGLDGSRGGVEIYYRCGRLYPAELDTLLRRFGLPERGAEIAGCLQALTRRTIRFELPSFDMGFSAALAEDGEPLAFTWYSASAALLGPVARAREAILRVGRASGWPVGGYERLTAPNPDGSVAHHGLIGMTIPRDGGMQMSATVAALPLPGAAAPRSAAMAEDVGHA